MNEFWRKDDESYLVLSIDGGGFRGIACLLIIAHLMAEIACGTADDAPRPCQIFDLICGTSTGGLIAILLGRFGLGCGEAIEIYREVGATMFDGEKDLIKIWGHIAKAGPLSSAEFERQLEDLVIKYTGSKDTLFEPLENAPDSIVHDSTKTFVTVVSTVGSEGVDAYRIRSYPRHPKDTEPAPHGHKWTIFESARGTCAIPLYLSPLKIQCDNSAFTFQDAGHYGFNNPAKAALDEARSIFGADATITLVSLGTGLRSLITGGQLGARTNRECKLGKHSRNAPQVAKQLAKRLLDVAADVEVSHSRVYDDFTKRGQRHNYHRFNPPQGLGDIEFTDYTQEPAISAITDAWLSSPAGQAAISSAVESLKNRWSPDPRPRRASKGQPQPPDSDPSLV